MNTTVNKISFDDILNIEKMDIDVFLSLPPVPQQRNTISRAKKKSTQDMLKSLHPSHLDVGVVELTKDCLYYGKKYKKGERFTVNGNTRSYYWKNGMTNAIPTHVNATIYKVDNMEQVREIYNTYDNPSATERNQEKLYGIIYRSYDYTAQSSLVEKGAFLTALQYACYCFDPVAHTLKADNLPFKVKEYIEEIKAFDVICKSPKYWDQALICSALMLLKLYGTNNAKLNEFLRRIDGRCMDTTKAERDGATHVCLEWSNNEKWKTKRTNFKTEGSLIETVPFILYWAEKFIQDKKQTQLGGGWEKKAEDWFKQYNATNNALNKIILEQLEENTEV